MDLHVNKLVSELLPPQNSFIVPPLALKAVTSKTGMGVYASSDTLFKGAVFGRDSLEVAEDIMQIKPRLVRDILITLARLQGTVTNRLREEQPGKIIHEYRSTVVDNKPISSISRHIFEELSRKWGGNHMEMAYYGSVDATPHFIRTLGTYCTLYGEEILDLKVQQRNNRSTTIREATSAAVAWLQKQLEKSQSGLLEYRRTNPHGILNQAWKDSNEFYVHEDGTPANHDKPIASIEVQGLVYDAFMAAAKLFPDQAKQYKHMAHSLRRRTIELLWLPEKHYFALGIDYDLDDSLRVIKTPTANPAALLDTEFFDNSLKSERQTYITAIAEKIMSYDFLTNAGVRSRALSAAHLSEFWDYHGSFVSWPKETYDIAKGLFRQGMPVLGRQLENRLLNVVLKNRAYPEFVYVDGHGRVLSGTPSTHTHGEITLVDGTNTPERIQAWTVSAVLAIVSRRLSQKLGRAHQRTRESWRGQLEKHIYHHIPRVNRHFNPLALRARYPTYRYKLTRIGKP